MVFAVCVPTPLPVVLNIEFSVYFFYKKRCGLQEPILLQALLDFVMQLGSLWLGVNKMKLFICFNREKKEFIFFYEGEKNKEK